MQSTLDLFNRVSEQYKRPDDIDFPVSKIRLFVDFLWQYLSGAELTEEQKRDLKALIDLLNSLDEHKHSTTKELIATMMPSVTPLLESMPTLGLSVTHVFTHLVPMYQHYLTGIEEQVRNAHAFTKEETILYYEITLFDHLFLVHLFEHNQEYNVIELLATLKTIIFINAIVYDYHQHTQGRAISFFTFLQRGGITPEQLHPFMIEIVNTMKEDTRGLVQNKACLEAMDFLADKLLATTVATTSQDAQVNEQKEEATLTEAIQEN